MLLKKLFRIGLLTVAASAVTAGCAYRTDLVQGNFVEQEAVNKLRYGMTAEQVQYVLGSPMLTDPFDPSRRYYVHFIRRGWNDPNVKNLIAVFDGRILVDIAGDFQKPAEFGNINAVEQKIDLSGLQQKQQQ